MNVYTVQKLHFYNAQDPEQWGKLDYNKLMDALKFYPIFRDVNRNSKRNEFLQSAAPSDEKTEYNRIHRAVSFLGEWVINCRCIHDVELDTFLEHLNTIIEVVHPKHIDSVLSEEAIKDYSESEKSWVRSIRKKADQHLKFLIGYREETLKRSGKQAA